MKTTIGTGVVLLLLASTTAHAIPMTYSITGPDRSTGGGCPEPPIPCSSLDSSVTGTFTTDAPDTAGLVIIENAVVPMFSFTDGVTTVTQSTAGYVSFFAFAFEMQQITSWVIDIFRPDLSGVVAGEHTAFGLNGGPLVGPSFGGAIYCTTDDGAACTSRVLIGGPNSTGTITKVPEPGSLLLLCAGLAAFAFVGQRSRA